MALMLNPAAEFDYNARVRELFADLRHARALPSLIALREPPVIATVGARDQGAELQLWMWIEARAQQVQEVGYQAYGCPHFLAGCETLARWLKGRSIGELSRWSWRDVEAELDVPASKRARLLVLETALLAIQKRIGGSALP
jgi:NifU-like protein involved in Fe-S cluster formation